MSRLAKLWASLNLPEGWWLIPGGVIGVWLWILLLRMAVVL